MQRIIIIDSCEECPDQFQGMCVGGERAISITEECLQRGRIPRWCPYGKSPNRIQKEKKRNVTREKMLFNLCVNALWAIYELESPESHEGIFSIMDSKFFRELCYIVEEGH